MEKKSDPGSGINIPDLEHCILTSGLNPCNIYQVYGKCTYEFLLLISIDFHFMIILKNFPSYLIILFEHCTPSKHFRPD